MLFTTAGQNIAIPAIAVNDNKNPGLYIIFTFSAHIIIIANASDDNVSYVLPANSAPILTIYIITALFADTEFPVIML